MRCEAPQVRGEEEDGEKGNEPSYWDATENLPAYIYRLHLFPPDPKAPGRINIAFLWHVSLAIRMWTTPV